MPRRKQLSLERIQKQKYNPTITENIENKLNEHTDDILRLCNKNNYPEEIQQQIIQIKDLIHKIIDETFQWKISVCQYIPVHAYDNSRKNNNDQILTQNIFE